MAESGEGHVEICLIGPVRGIVNGRVVEITAGKITTLLSLLAIHRPYAIKEADLGFELWLGDPPTEYAAALRTYVSVIRRKLGTLSILTSGASYRLNTELVSVDIDRVKRAYESVDPALTGRERVDVLGDIHRSLNATFFGGTHDAEAIVAETRMLQELAESARVDWLEARLNAGESASLCPELRRLLRYEPEHERIAGLLMKALARSGQRSAALGVFNELNRLLAKQGLTPDPALTALEHEIIMQSSNQVTVPGSLTLPPIAEATAPSFAGREDLIEELSRTDLTNAVVIGDSSTGKTALAVQVARRFTSSGLRVHYASAAEISHPLGIFADAIPALQPMLGGAIDVMVRQILSIANDGPTLCLVFDDLQVAPPETIDAISRLAKSTTNSIVLRLFAEQGRDWSAISPVCFEIPPMSRSDVEAVLKKRLRTRPEPTTVDWVCELSGGWAGVVSVMAGYLATGGTPLSGTDQPLALDLVFTPFGVIGRRILGCLAYADVIVEPSDLASWAGAPETTVRDVLSRARAIGILHPSGTARFRHGLYATQALSALTTSEKAALSKTITANLKIPSWDRAHHSLLFATASTWQATLALTRDGCVEANNSRRATSTIKLVESAMLKEKSLGLAPTDKFHLLDSASIAHELLGDVVTAADRRVEAFEVAVHHNLVNEAVECALRGPVSGRSIADEIQRSLVRRSMMLEIPSGNLGDRLLSEMVFTTLFQLDPPTELIVRSIARLKAATAADDSLTTAMAHRALYLSRIGGLIHTQVDVHISGLLESAKSCSHLDVQSMALVYGVRNAIATGNSASIHRAIADHEAFAAESGRPADVWARDVIQATWLQLTGRRHSSRTTAQHAHLFGQKYGAGDADLAWLVYQLSSAAMNGQPTDPQDEEAVRSYALWGPLFLDINNFEQSTAASSLNGLVEAFLHLPQTIATLPTIAWATQLLWKSRQVEPARTLLDKLNKADTGERFIVVGHIPVSTAGPVSRVRALLLALIAPNANNDQIIALFKEAFAVCEDAGARGWTVNVLLDQAAYFRSVGNDKEANRSIENARALTGFEVIRNSPKTRKPKR